jgi:hypothetical protein
MILMNGSRTPTGQFLFTFAQGLGQTHFEIILLFSFVVVGLLVLAFYSLAQRISAHRELERSSGYMLEHLLGKLDLSNQEAALLGHLSRFRNKGESAHSLLTDQSVFDGCVRRMRQSEDLPEVPLEALELKIGLRSMGPPDAPVSSNALPEGTALLLIDGAGKSIRGSILAQGADAMFAQPDAGTSVPLRDTRLTCYFHDSARFYSFSTRVTKVANDTMYLSHSSDIAQLQRGRWRGRKQPLPVFIKSSPTELHPRESYLLDIGGGGARIQNAGRRVRRGDLVEISFSPLMRKSAPAARVVRLTRNGKIIGVRFELVSEENRSRIMAFLVAQSEQRESGH